jgi:hypothetical protein
VLPDGLNWLCYFAGSSKSRRENSISFIFLESPYQVNMKNVVKSSKTFFEYFNSQCFDNLLHCSPETIASHYDALCHFCTYAHARDKFAKSLPLPLQKLLHPIMTRFMPFLRICARLGRICKKSACWHNPSQPRLKNWPKDSS